MVSNARYLIFVFMNFNENLKDDRKIIKIHIQTNFRPKLSLCHFVIEPVISYDNFIDVMGLNKNYLIYIFMKINKNIENRGKTWEKNV